MLTQKYMIDFYVRNRNHEFYLKIIQHKENSANELKRRIDSFFKLDTIEHELDLYHLILKHGRGCDHEQCAALINFDAMQHLIINLVPQISYSLLVCLIDLVKNSPSTLSQDTLHSFLSFACNLWQHEKIYMCRKSMELCKRIIPLLQDLDIMSHIIQYIQTCQQVITRQDIERMQSSDYTEFFYTPMNMTFDRECIKLIIQIILSVFLYHPTTLGIETLITETKDLRNQDSLEFKTILFDTCCANDDDTVELLDTILTIYQQQHSSTMISFLQSIDMNPHSLFLFFLHQCGDTHAIIIDLLLDNDSDFLAWFHRYIRFAITDIDCLKSSLVDLDGFLTVIVNTVLALEGGGFPYNTKPLVRRLVQLEDELLLE